MGQWNTCLGSTISVDVVLSQVSVRASFLLDSQRLASYLARVDRSKLTLCYFVPLDAVTEMLDSETKLCETEPSHTRVISWSSTGKAFRIYDTAEFANVVLPKYFRTKKFSSFQRNLNLVSHTHTGLPILLPGKRERTLLEERFSYPPFHPSPTQYGFTKIRRGPDVDMYAHPSFVRDTPETLLQLRKITNGSRTKRPTQEVSMKYSSRAVSPLSNQAHQLEHHHRHPHSPVITNIPKIIVPKVGQWGSSTAYTSTISTTSPDLAPKAADRGKLDLLALALEQQQAAAH